MKVFQYIAALVTLMGLSTLLPAQNDFEEFQQRANAQFNAFSQRAQEDFNTFRRKANEEFAKFMERAWAEMELQPGVKPPERPKPERPPVAVPDRIPPSEPEPMPVLEVVPVPDRVPPPEIDPEEAVNELPLPSPSDPTTNVMFYGTQCALHMNVAQRIKISAISEKAAADAWRQLSDGRYDALLRDCLSLRSALRLCDWGYIELARHAANAAAGQSTNEAILLQGWLLSQSGIETRLACTDSRFILMVPFNVEIYTCSFITIDNHRFYLLDKTGGRSVRVCNMAFPKTQMASLYLPQLPNLAMSRNGSRTFVAEHFSNIRVSVSVNKHLVQFFDNYPRSNSYSHLVNASLSDDLKQQLYPILRKQIEGKSKKKQVRMLLDFVQTSFNYKTDDDQFGYERPFFGDESFFHPYNDCEDRSILFSILVRELVGLDVVLLSLPNHIATAVHFDEEVPGKYYVVNGRRYTVCDPTYIGADIGEAMPKFRNAKAEIMVL